MGSSADLPAAGPPSASPELKNPHLTVIWTCILRTNIMGPDAQEVMPFESVKIVYRAHPSADTGRRHACVHKCTHLTSAPSHRTSI